jgi:hypothetical protein
MMYETAKAAEFANKTIACSALLSALGVLGGLSRCEDYDFGIQ